MEIKFKHGVHIKAKPEAVFNELERVRELGDGDIELSILVIESKPTTAVLHDEFEWSNAKAANKYRVEQARYIVRSLEITYDKSEPARAYQSVRVIEAETTNKPAKAKYVFRSMEDVMKDPETRDELLGQAIRDALAYRKRYQALQELAKIFVAMDEVLMEIKA